MRRPLLVLLALCALVTALAPEPAPARSLLGLLFGVHVHRGHRHHYAYHYRRGRAVHYARHWGARHWRREAVRAAAPGAAAASTVVATSPAASASLYWPGAYRDLVGFTFASGAADNGPFWGHGSRDIFSAIIVAPEAGGASQSPGARASGEGTPEPPPTPACASTNDVAAADTAFKQVEDRLAPKPEQRPAFADLHDAMVRAQTRINATCAPAFSTAAPPERMKAISDLLWALRQAMLTLRTPLEKTYKELDDRQRARLNTPGFKVACTGDTAQLSWPRDQIEQVIQPNDQQRAALEMLRLTSLQMGQAISSSCPRQPLTTPLQRLDAAGDRLNTMLYAAMIVSRALGNAYASLSDQQKANFSTIGRLLGSPHAAGAQTADR